jgi:hypothetical protein
MRITAALPLLLFLTAAAEGPVSFKFRATEAIPNDSGSFSTPALLVSCENGKTSADVRWDFAIASGQVQGAYSIDGGTAVPVTWAMTPDGSITLIDQPQKFLTALAGKTTLDVEVSPEGGSVVAAFKLDGLEQGLAPVRAACGW